MEWKIRNYHPAMWSMWGRNGRRDFVQKNTCFIVMSWKRLYVLFLIICTSKHVQPITSQPQHKKYFPWEGAIAWNINPVHECSFLEWKKQATPTQPPPLNCTVSSQTQHLCAHLTLSHIVIFLFRRHLVLYMVLNILLFHSLKVL